MTAPLSPSDLAEIEAVAKAATGSEWFAHDRGVGWEIYIEPGNPYAGRNPDGTWPPEPEQLPGGSKTDIGRAADAAHIARMDPATTLALLAWGKRAEDAVARVREVAEACGKTAAWLAITAPPAEADLVLNAQRAILDALDADDAAGGAG